VLLHPGCRRRKGKNSIQPQSLEPARRSRIFYGWAIAAVACLITFSSGPGQSYTFSVFVDPIIDDTGLSRTMVSFLYAVGTAVSAVMVSVVGRLIDRFGPRRMLIIIALLFGLACLIMASASGPLGIFAGFAALRALGQGSMPVTATLLTAQWFVRYRGRAMALVTLGFAISNGFFPPVAQALIGNVGWRTSYLLLGGGIVLALVTAAIVVVRDRPEAVGLFPDGADGPPEQEVATGTETTDTRDRRRVFTAPAFWMLALPLSVGPFAVTALVFHQASIFAERGLSAAMSAAAFPAFAVASALATPLAGLGAERFGPRAMIYLTLLLQSIAMIGLIFIGSPPAAIAYAIVIGAASGIQSVSSGVTWAHYYGRQGLGRIQGSATTVLISGAALAPLPLAALQQWTGSYTPGLLLMALLPLLGMLLLAQFRPEKLQQL
jgi:MFS family permease